MVARAAGDRRQHLRVATCAAGSPPPRCTDSDVIKITVADADSNRARDLANVVAQGFEEEQQSSIDGQVKDVGAAIDTDVRT